MSKQAWIYFSDLGNKCAVLAVLRSDREAKLFLLSDLRSGNYQRSGTLLYKKHRTRFGLVCQEKFQGITR